MSIDAMKKALHVFKEIYEGLGNVKKSDAHKDAKDLATVMRKDCNFAMRDLTQAIEEAEKQEAKRKWFGVTTKEANEIYEHQQQLYKAHVDYEDFLLILIVVETYLKKKNS